MLRADGEARRQPKLREGFATDTAISFSTFGACPSSTGRAGKAVNTSPASLPTDCSRPRQRNVLLLGNQGGRRRSPGSSEPTCPAARSPKPRRLPTRRSASPSARRDTCGHSGRQGSACFSLMSMVWCLIQAARLPGDVLVDAFCRVRRVGRKSSPSASRPSLMHFTILPFFATSILYQVDFKSASLKSSSAAGSCTAPSFRGTR